MQAVLRYSRRESTGRGRGPGMLFLKGLILALLFFLWAAAACGAAGQGDLTAEDRTWKLVGTSAEDRAFDAHRREAPAPIHEKCGTGASGQRHPLLISQSRGGSLLPATESLPDSAKLAGEVGWGLGRRLHLALSRNCLLFCTLSSTLSVFLVAASTRCSNKVLDEVRCPQGHFSSAESWEKRRRLQSRDSKKRLLSWRAGRIADCQLLTASLKVNVTIEATKRRPTKIRKKITNKTWLSAGGRGRSFFRRNCVGRDDFFTVLFVIFFVVSVESSLQSCSQSSS